MQGVSNKAFFAEFIGTLVLVFMGCGAAVFLGCDAAGGHLAVAFSFGLSIVAMAYVIGNVSGCHVNPAVSLGMLLAGRIDGKTFSAYLGAQFSGAIVGAALLKKLADNYAPGDQTGGLGANGFGTVGMTGAIVVEVILTFIFVFTILGVTADESKGAVAGLVIGLTLTFVHIVGIPLTGTSVNPARSFGPAIFAEGTQALEQYWVFLVAPLAGAALAALLYKAVAKPKAA
ncbi:MAG: MIP family channel protein [Clostridiales Family XIII bacterium]|jgi:aquaporin Z|nr:MIP family channel protein [Clostridiales Family XIII bacterium]